MVVWGLAEFVAFWFVTMVWFLRLVIWFGVWCVIDFVVVLVFVFMCFLVLLAL